MFDKLKSYLIGIITILAVVYFGYEGSKKIQSNYNKITNNEEKISIEQKMFEEQQAEIEKLKEENKKIPSKQEIEDILKNYILENPDIISDALDKLQQVRMDELKKKVQEKIIEKKEQLESNSSPYIGNEHGKSIIVMFYDYNCGYCKQSYDAVNALVNSNPDVKVILKTYPILGTESEFLAKLSTAIFIKDKAKFKAIHEELISDKVYNKDDLIHLFKTHGLNFSEIEHFSDSEEVSNILKENFLLARDLKINGVPAFVINGIYHPGHLTLEQLSEKIAIPANFDNKSESEIHEEIPNLEIKEDHEETHKEESTKQQ